MQIIRKAIRIKIKKERISFSFLISLFEKSIIERFDDISNSEGEGVTTTELKVDEIISRSLDVGGDDWWLIGLDDSDDWLEGFMWNFCDVFCDVVLGERIKKSEWILNDWRNVSLAVITIKNNKKFILKFF